MSATFPADVFADHKPTGEWISEHLPAAVLSRKTPGCYVSMNREFGARPSLETVHECPGRTDWNCPVGVALELETAQIERELDANWN
jgi:hypothetical protein